MRLLVAELSENRAWSLEQRLGDMGLNWSVEYAADGIEALNALCEQPSELMLLHGCLPGLDGEGVLQRLWQGDTPCVPRVLLITEPELRTGAPADCVAPLYTSDDKRAQLLATLSGCVLPVLSRRQDAKRRAVSGALLDRLGMPCALKGREYVLWLLSTLIHTPSFIDALTLRLYPACAKAYGVSAGSVERCVRHAIEQTFTVGSISAIEGIYGAAVDPERGKLTNRAFLLATSQKLRQALLSTRSRNNSEMHQSPAAPMIV